MFTSERDQRKKRRRQRGEKRGAGRRGETEKGGVKSVWNTANLLLLVQDSDSKSVITLYSFCELFS